MKSDQSLKCEVKKVGGNPFRPNNEADTMAAVARLEKAQYDIVKRDDKANTIKT